MTIPLEDEQANIFLTDKDNDLMFVSKIFKLFIDKGFVQATATFSGGGDNGSINDWTALKKKIFKTSKDLSPFESENATFIDINSNGDKNIHRYSTHLGDLLEIDCRDLTENAVMVDKFYNFLFNYAITADFNGDCYSYGCILIDFISGTVLTKTRMEVKTEENLDDQVVKVNNDFSFVSDNTVFDDL
jgi:hypothetical protein